MDEVIKSNYALKNEKWTIQNFEKPEFLFEKEGLFVKNNEISGHRRQNSDKIPQIRSLDNSKINDINKLEQKISCLQENIDQLIKLNLDLKSQLEIKKIEKNSVENRVSTTEEVFEEGKESDKTPQTQETVNSQAIPLPDNQIHLSKSKKFRRNIFYPIFLMHF